MKRFKLCSLALVFLVVLTGSACANTTIIDTRSDTKGTITSAVSETIEYPITDAWVYRYNIQTGKSDFAPCGYIDEYTSLVADTDKTVSRAITGTYMYLGTIKGYQNKDKTIEVYQVRLPELSENFVLTNDNIELDYSGNSKMIEVDGWIYMDGTTIIAVSPLYSED